MRTVLKKTAPDGFHLFGFLSGGFGLGEAARQTLRRMLERDIPVVTRDVDTLDHRLGQVQEFAHRFEKRPNYWPFQINLFHINPPELERLLLHQWPKAPVQKCLNVIVPFWELPTPPPEWIPCLQAMDAVLTPTKYIQNTIQRALPDKPVLHFPQNIPVGEPALPNRTRFGLPDDAFIFLCAFDVMSDVTRKNPCGSITAFKKAFPGTPNVRLVLKASNADDPDALQELARAIGNDERILILTERFSRETLQQLYASCDALISLHRAEGLGLFIMEMMAQAKPVIVTAWSGNMDFTTSETACLVDFSMIPVRASHPDYQHTAEALNLCWADADTDQAADWMKRLTSDPAFCEQIGKNARSCMLEREQIDCRSVFEQLSALQAQGSRKTPDPHAYFDRQTRPIKKRLRRQRIRRIEKAVKKVFRH